jgi:hypothetical protein
MGSGKKKKESTTDETIDVPELYSENVSKVAEDIKEPSQSALRAFSNVILNTLHALGVDKHVVVEFDPDIYDSPLHTHIIISKPLEENGVKIRLTNLSKNSMKK